MMLNTNFANKRASARTWYSYALLALATVFMSSSVVADVSKVEEFDFDLDDGGTLSIENINGDITITSGTDGRVYISAIKKAERQDYLDGMEIKVSASDERIKVRTEHPRNKDSWFNFGGNSGSVSYEIVVPENTRLDSIETVNGEIEIAGVRGDVSVDTTNGDINLNNLRGSLEADTVNGSIDAAFDSLGGDQRIQAETVNGRVTLRLPADASARVDAGTVNGGIDADDFGLKVDKGFLGRDLDGEIGDGDARINVSTVNGGIKIRKN